MKRKKIPSKRSATAAGKSRPVKVDDYLAGLERGQRAALQKLRKTIKAAVPGAEECIAYQIPAFRLNGKFLVAYAAAKEHCAFYPGSVVQAVKKELKDYDIDKGTVRFSPKKSLPTFLVRKLVKLRTAEVEGK